ncbi:hypothetical protein ACHHYP_16601 [Achlya hypogyna]|uniref:Inositol-pentakisphosphate 2-kinase n=1 Tax=Achlya hypogyna TaxID=1202772 RepID=A0A1V9Y6D1_ACHHY|nr:hypothetical protein ACHHYP_16601 [Achlya hypogyna]
MLLAGHRPRSRQDVASTTLVATDWDYVAEGGANVVFRYGGTETSPLANYVLRIRKAGVRGALPGDIVAFADAHAPSSAYSQVAVAVSVSSTFLCAMNDVLQGTTSRPSHRRGVHLDVNLLEVLLLPEMAFSSPHALSIELKPKYGRLAAPSDLVHEAKRTTCRFCMHQHLKVAEGKARHRSAYCPIRLFAPETMADALSALFTTPQNNLRLFPSTTAWNDAMIRSVLVALLTQVPVLEDLQRMHALDRLDIEGLFQLAQVHARLEQCSQEELADGTASLGSLLPPGTISESTAQLIQRATTAPNWANVPFTDWQRLYAHLVNDFMVATTYKDCSLLVAMAPFDTDDTADSDTHLITLPDGAVFKCKVAIVDVDPKSHKPLEYYHALDADIVAHFAATDDGTFGCAPMHT